jgi:hypothetical protein
MFLRTHRIGHFACLIGLSTLAFALGYMRRDHEQPARAESPNPAATAPPPSSATTISSSSDPLHLLQSPGYSVDRRGYDYGLGDDHVSKLPPYPPFAPGVRMPFDLWKYAGRDKSSFGNATLHMPWKEWVEMCSKQKPKLMADCKEYMNRRYNFHNQVIEKVTMSGGKPIMKGPVARLPGGVQSWETRPRPTCSFPSNG